MAARTGNFSFVAAGVITRLAAVFLACVTSARNVRALLFVCLCHKTSSINRAHLRRDTLVAEIRPRVASRQNRPFQRFGQVGRSKAVSVDIEILASKRSRYFL